MSSRPHIQAFIFIFLWGPCTETAEMSIRVHLGHEHWINLVDLYNAERVCRVLVGCRGGFYGIVSKIFFLLACFFLLITSLLLTVQQPCSDSPDNSCQPRCSQVFRNFSMPIHSPAHLQRLMGSGAPWAGSSGLDVTAVHPQILYKRTGGEGEILLQPGRSVPCPS